ncbi:MAG: YqgE/AlgH family protein [Kiloniellales bacterium]|nr:YqgE/AlgH family protein [Kiloniellales bacterium]
MTRNSTIFTSLRPRLYAFGLLAVLLIASAGPADPAGTEGTEGETETFLAGRLLIAREDLRDPNFDRTVVFMLRHDRRGAMGLVINRRLGQVPLQVLLDEMGVEIDAADAEIAAHYGGPVEPGRGFLLHSDDAVLESSQRLPGGFAVSGDPEMLRRILEGSGPKDFRFVLGYAGWAPGQLESEIARGSWWDVEADPALVFHADIASIWRRAIDRRGVDL